jgi:hypothetical protein
MSVGNISSHDVTASIWDGEQYVAVTDAGEVFVSKDASEWTLRSVVLNGRVTGIAYSGSRYILTGENMYSSTNLRRWEMNKETMTAHINAVIYTDGLFWAVGQGGKILFSPDGLKWVESVSSTNENLHAIAGTLTDLVAVGDNGVILEWKAPLWVAAREGHPGQPSLYGLAYHDGQFVAVGAHGTVWSATSLVGVDHWSMHSSGTDAWLLAATYLMGSDQFVAVGTGGTAVVSADGDTWEHQAVTVTADLWSLLTPDGMMIYALGQGGAILTRASESAS